MLAPFNHILPLTTIVRERTLPTSGTVLARLNQKVSPTDVVAEASWAREHVLVDVASTLNLSPAAADRLLRCKVGDNLPAGAEVAVKRGILSKSVKTPKEGRVIAAGGGQVLLETGAVNVQLRAGLPGNVIQIIPGRGVVIQTAGALIQGVWGNGRIDTGLMVNLADKADGVLSVARLDVSLRGSIVLGGLCKDADSLKAAADVPVRGLILSSIFPSLLPMAREMRFPIVVTDGFGALPMNSVAYRLLSTNAKREVTLNAEVYDRYSGARPEVIIPLPVSQDPPLPIEAEEFATGQTVRMRRPPSFGAIGTIVSLRPGLTTLTSGLRAPAADVKMETGETVIVPLVNLEVVG
ncbi:MAG TPA: hypothetical protein VMT73_06680 [Anaerolineales bacterium]|nr:hypothetical protein [Anaerolineales bacterium]